MTTPGPSIGSVRPQVLTALLGRLRDTAPVSAPLVTRLAHVDFRRPVPAPVLRAVDGAVAARAVLVPTNLGALTRPRQTADPTPALVPDHGPPQPIAANIDSTTGDPAP